MTARITEKTLLKRVKTAISSTKSLGSNLKYYVKNPQARVPGNSPEEQDAISRRKDYVKTRQRRESVELEEGIFSSGSVRPSLISDHPLVHAYATGYNHPRFNNSGDVEPPKRNHVAKVGKQRIPSLNAYARISDFEHALRQNGHDEKTAHIHGAIHSYDFHNNPTKHDEVLPNSARNLVKKTRGSGMEAAMRGVMIVRALFRKPDKPNM